MSNGMLAVLLLTALTVEWKLRVLWKVSCVGRCFAGADTWRKVSLKWTQVEGCFAKASLWNDTWWRLLLITCMYWFVSHVLCSTCQDSINTKKTCVLVVSCKLHNLGRLAVIQLIQTHILRQDTWWSTIFGGGAYRTQQTVMGLASLRIFVSLRHSWELLLAFWWHGLRLRPGHSC